jgi:plasmid stabilization system protein ParE
VNNPERQVTINVTPRATADIQRLDDFVWEQDDPLAGELYAYIIKALRVLALQPGIGRPVGVQMRVHLRVHLGVHLRELIIDRGRGGYLARYQYLRGANLVTILRIRHQSESGYTFEEV